MITIGMIALGAIAVLSMVMMIGTVLAKSRYGKFWALLGGASVFMAAVLLVLKAFAPPAEANAAAPQDMTPAQEQAATQSVKPGDTLTINPKQSQQVDPIAAAAGDDKDLAFLGKVMELLKEGKPLPKEYLALLPDGGQGILVAQAKSGAAAPEISKPLQTQLVAIDRSNGNGQTRYASSSYLPSTSSGSSTTPATGGSKATPATPASNGGNSGGGTAKPQPQPQPQPGTGSGGQGSQQPPKQDPPPAPPKQDPPPPPPPVSGTPSLLDGGLIKSLLGQSQDNMVQYFQYNQDLGLNGNVHRYLRGDRIIEATVENNRVTRVMMRFQSFSPQGRDSTYYEDVMRQAVGLSKANASSRSSSDISWRSVYPGASNVLFHIDTAANYGYVQASL